MHGKWNWLAPAIAIGARDQELGEPQLAAYALEAVVARLLVRDPH